MAAYARDTMISSAMQHVILQFQERNSALTEAIKLHLSLGKCYLNCDNERPDKDVLTKVGITQSGRGKNR
jgi:hypothetical protein